MQQQWKRVPKKRSDGLKGEISGLTEDLKDRAEEFGLKRSEMYIGFDRAGL